MILAIERNSFNYLYKYNQIKLNIDNLIDISFDDNFIKNKIEFLVRQFDRALPIFEEDHELLLLEVNKNELDFNGTISLTFKAVLKIFPLTSVGKRLLEGRLNKNLIIGNPVFENVIEEVKINRSIENRILAAKKLHSAFSLHPLIKTIDFNIIKSSVINILKGNYQGPINFLQELIEYNKTPNYIPDGNIEYLLKIGLIAIKSMGRDESAIQNGPYYHKSIGELKFINSGTLKDSYERFRAIKDAEFQKSLIGICTQISTSTKDVDIFKVSYYYIAFKNYLLKNEFNLIGLGSAIKLLIKEDNVAASWVLTLLGYSFSFEKLYETLHKLDPDQVYVNDIQKKAKDERKLKDAVNDPPEKKYRQKLDNLSLESNPQANPSNSIKSVRGNEFIAHESSVENLKLTNSAITDNYTEEMGHTSLLDVPEKIGDNEAILVEGQTTDIENAQKTIMPDVSNEGIDQIESNDNYDDSIDSISVKVSDLLIRIGQRKLNKKTEKLMNLIGNSFDPKSSISLRDFQEFIYQNRKSFDTDTIDTVEMMFKGNLS